MKKIYLNIFKFGGLFFLMSLFITTVSAQVLDLQWTGATSDDAHVTTNWNPENVIEGNRLLIDSAFKFINLPVLRGAETDNVVEIVPQRTGKFTFEKVGNVLVNINLPANFYMIGEYHVKSGDIRTAGSRNWFMDNSNAILRVEGGRFQMRDLLMGQRQLETDPVDGGFMFITGNGSVESVGPGQPGRFCVKDTTLSRIYLNDNGNFIYSGSGGGGNWLAEANRLIGTEQFWTEDDRDVIAEFDGSRTVVYSRPGFGLFVQPRDAQNLIAGEEGNVIRLDHNRGFDEMVSIAWKYGTTPGGPYDQTLTGQDGDTIVPLFENPGVFYLVAEGTKADMTTKYSNEVRFIVASDLVLVTPAYRQELRIDQTGYTLTATVDPGITSGEWKVTTTSGAGYTSFTPAQTGLTYDPVFSEAGTYYVLYEGLKGAEVHRGPEVTIVVNNNSRTIRWNGNYSDQAGDMRNWTPMARLRHNTLAVDPADYGINPTPRWTDPGNDTIVNISTVVGSVFTFAKPNPTDTVRRSGDQYAAGELRVESGVWHITGRLRLESGTAKVTVTGGMIHINTDFIMGTSNFAAGAQVEVSGNGTIHAGSQIWRFANDTTQSVIRIKDNGKVTLTSNWNTTPNGNNLTYAQIVARNQIMTDEGRLLHAKWDDVTNLFVIYSRSETAFSIEPTARQVVGVDTPASLLTTVNTDGVTAYEWKYRLYGSADAQAFDPPAAGATFAPEFNAAGNYFVFCEATTGEGVVKSNEVNIEAVSVAVAPAEKQTVDFQAFGTELSVAESLVPDSRVWKYSTTSGADYQPFDPAQEGNTYTPYFAKAGTYYVVCMSTFGDVVIVSNEVEIELSPPVITVTPADAQTIEVDEAGAMLEVTESALSDGVEWMYSTTAGADYVSFDPAETNYTYTPLFDAEGVYYVICMSFFGDDGYPSNEVTINVNPSSVGKLSQYPVSVYPNPADNKFWIDAGDLATYQVQITDIAGKILYVRDVRNETGRQEFNIPVKGIYLLRITAKDESLVTPIVIE